MVAAVVAIAGAAALVAPGVRTRAGALTPSLSSPALSPASGVQSAAGLAAPLQPTVTPGVESLVVTWSAPLEGTGVESYQVTSSPRATKTCTTTALTCTFAGIRDATAWRFAVRYETASGWSPFSSYSNVVPHRSLVIVAGQSNAVGLGSVALNHGINLLTSTATSADRAVKLAWDQPFDANPNPVGLSSSGPVKLSTPQLRSWGAPGQIGAVYFGPELGIARDLYIGGVSDLVVLKVAASGTTLVAAPAPWAARTGSLYQRLVADTHALMATEAAQGISLTVGGVVWYQGESDTAPGVAPYYLGALQSFLSDLHADLGEGSTTPTVLVKEDMVYGLYEQLVSHVITEQIFTTAEAANQLVRSADDFEALHVGLQVGNRALAKKTTWLSGSSVQRASSALPLGHGRLGCPRDGGSAGSGAAGTSRRRRTGAPRRCHAP